MWIFMNKAALSIVADRHEENNLMVRARIKGDIEQVFPDADVLSSPDADYAYRASIPRHVVASKISLQINRIEYGDFKSSVKDEGRHRGYSEIWSCFRGWARQIDRALRRG